MKYLHRFPILDAAMSTTDLVAEARLLLPKVAPDGYRLERCEWHRRGRELLLLADAVETLGLGRDGMPIQWVRAGLIWRAAA